jgi:hypothetical protein
VAINGERIWIDENFATKFTIPKREGIDPKEDVGDFIAAASLATFTAKLADVENDAAVYVPCELHFQTMNGWLPWMRMGRVPGAQSWQLYGHKVQDISAIPASLRARFEKDYPGWLEKPGI